MKQMWTSACVAALALAVVVTPAGASTDANVRSSIDIASVPVGGVLFTGSSGANGCDFSGFSGFLRPTSSEPYIKAVVETTPGCSTKLVALCTQKEACEGRGAPAHFIDTVVVRTPGTEPAGQTGNTDHHCLAYKTGTSVNRRVDAFLGTLETEAKHDMTFSFGCSDGSAYHELGVATCSRDWGYTTTACNSALYAGAPGCVRSGTDASFSSGASSHRLWADVHGCNSGSFTCIYSHSGAVPGNAEYECYQSA